jgi:DNA primase
MGSIESVLHNSDLSLSSVRITVKSVHHNERRELMDDRRPNFAEIKRRVSMLDVLKRYDVQLRAANQNSWAGKCPLPQHTSKDRDTFKVTHGKKGWGWACHSQSCVAARGTDKKGGDLIEFVKFMEQCRGLREAGLRLEEWFGAADNTAAVSESPQVDAVEVDEETPTNAPLTFTLQGITHAHPYLTVRGFDEEECEYLGVGFYPGKGMMRNRIVFPLHDASGQLVGYAGRRVEYSLHDEDESHVAPETSDTERWKFPPNFKRGQVVYNLHRVTEDDWTEIIVCESFWGVLGCVRAGIMNAVAIMSNTPTETQVKLLAGFEKVTVLFDGDEPGRQGTLRMLDALAKRNIPRLECCILRPNEQPDSIPPDELRRRLGLPPVPDGSLEVVEEHPHLQAVPA